MSYTATLLYDEVKNGKYLNLVQGPKPKPNQKNKQKPSTKNVDACMPSVEILYGSAYTSTVIPAVEEGVVMQTKNAQIKLIESGIAILALVAVAFAIALVTTSKLPKSASLLGLLMAGSGAAIFAWERNVRRRQT